MPKQLLVAGSMVIMEMRSVWNLYFQYADHYCKIVIRLENFSTTNSVIKIGTSYDYVLPNLSLETLESQRPVPKLVLMYCIFVRNSHPLILLVIVM